MPDSNDDSRVARFWEKYIAKLKVYNISDKSVR